MYTWPTKQVFCLYLRRILYNESFWMSIKSSFWHSKKLFKVSKLGGTGGGRERERERYFGQNPKDQHFFRKPSLSVRSRTQHWRVLDMNKYLDFIIYSIGGWKRSSQTFYWLIPVTSLDMPYQLKNLRKPMSIVFGFSKEFIGSVMRALKYKMFYITLIFIAEKIRAMLFIFCTSCIRLMNFVWLVVKM